MNLIETDFQFAVHETANEVKQTNPSKLCLTGGKFGSFLLNELIKINYAPQKENIYISDERLEINPDDTITSPQSKYFKPNLEKFIDER